MISPQFKFKKIIDFLFNTCRLAAEHLFLTSLVLILISLLLGTAAFYKYNILPQKIQPELGQGVTKFDEKTYQKIIDEWQGRGAGFEAAKTEQYPDLFKP